MSDVKEWGCLQHVSEESAALEGFEKFLIEKAKAKFEKEHPDYDILEVSKAELARPHSGFERVFYDDEDGTEQSYVQLPMFLVQLKVTKR